MSALMSTGLAIAAVTARPRARASSGDAIIVRTVDATNRQTRKSSVAAIAMRTWPRIRRWLIQAEKSLRSASMICAEFAKSVLSARLESDGAIWRVTVTMTKLKAGAARSSRPCERRYQQRTVSEAVAISVPAIWKPHGRALGMIALSGFIGRLLRGGRKLCGQWRRRWRYGRSGHR